MCSYLVVSNCIFGKVSGLICYIENKGVTEEGFPVEKSQFKQLECNILKHEKVKVTLFLFFSTFFVLTYNLKNVHTLRHDYFL